MNADTKNNILSLVVGAQQLDLERTRMLLEDQRMQIIEKTAGVTEEVFFYSRYTVSNQKSVRDQSHDVRSCMRRAQFARSGTSTKLRLVDITYFRLPSIF